MTTTTKTSEPYIRYTRECGPTDLSGWLVKEGRMLRQASPRYMHVSGNTLSNHRHEEKAPTWTLPLTNSDVTPGPRRHELTIRHTHRRLTLIASTGKDFRAWLFALRRAAAPTPSLDTFYTTGDVIGDGISGDVLAGCDRATGEPVAIKTLPWVADACDEAENAVTEEEIRIARSLDHAHLVKTYDVFRDAAASRVRIVMEYVAGGDLRARVDSTDCPPISETDCVRIARNLLSAIQYLHDHGIVHRDVKLENVLCVHADVGKPMRVKLADFGSSTTVTAKRPTLNSAVGTGYYLAPEIIEERPYGTPVDLWACGVLFYMVLSRQLPFLGLDLPEYSKNVISNDVEFPDEDWQEISTDAQDFIKKLMVRDPVKRMTAKEALHHRWVADGNGDGGEHDEDASSSSDGEDGTATLMDGPRSLFGRKVSAADVLAKKREKHK